MGSNLPVLRRRRAGIGDLYKVEGLKPELVADFDGEYYRTNDERTTFSSAITHAATSNATMVDSDGLLKWRPHNLLKYSEDITAGGWTVFEASLSAGSFGGQLIVENTALAISHVAQQVVSFVSGAEYTFTVKVKRATGTRNFRLNAANTATFALDVYFNLSDGSIIAETLGSGSVSGPDADGFYTLTATGTAGASASTNLRLSLTEGGDPTYDGDGVSSAEIKQPHLYRSDLGGMVNNPDTGDSYVPTTSTAVYLPRRGHHVWNGSAWVNEGLLHESEARTNLVPENMLFEATGWVQDPGTTSNGLTGTKVGSGFEDGEPYIDVRVTGTATNTFGSELFNKTGPTRTAASTGEIFTGSVKGRFIDTTAVPGTCRVICTTVGETAPFAFVDQENSPTTMGGDAGRILPTDTTDKSIYSTHTVAGAVDQIRWAIVPEVTNGNTYDFTVRLKLAQFEEGSTPSSFIPTYGAPSGAHRAAETLTVPAANLPWPTPQVIGTLIDEDFSSYADQTAAETAGYVFTGCTLDAANDQVDFAVAAQNFRIDGVETFVEGSVYEVTFTTSGGTVGEVYFQDNFTDFQYTSDSTNGTFTFVFVKRSGTNVRFGSATFDGSIDSYTVREIDPLAVSIQMQGRVTYADTDSSIEAWMVQWQTDGSNKIAHFLNTSSAATGRLSVQQAESGVFDTVSPATGSPLELSPGILVPFNFAGRHGSTFINGAVDGTAPTADITPVALPDLSSADLNLGSNYNGTIRTFRVWAADLGDTGIEDATLPSLEPSLSLLFDGSEGSFTVDDWSE